MKGKILAVDDDPDIIDALAIIVEANGYQFLAARDGAEGLAKLRLEKPDAIILDLLMPRMDGFVFCREIGQPEWKEFRATPILLLTALREEATRRRYELETGCALSADDYVEKPIIPEALLKKIERAIAKR